MTCWATLSPASTTPGPTSAPSWPRTGPRVWSMTRTRLTFQRPRPRCDPGIKIGIRDIIMREDYSHLQKRIWSRKDQLFVCLTILHDEISYIWECFASLLVRPELRITAWCLINICPPKWLTGLTTQDPGSGEITIRAEKHSDGRITSARLESYQVLVSYKRIRHSIVMMSGLVHCSVLWHQDAGLSGGQIHPAG